MGWTDRLQGLRRLRLQFALILAAAMAPAGVLSVVQALSNIEDARSQRLELLAADVRKAAEEEQSIFLSIRETLRIAARELEQELAESGSCARTLDFTTEDDPRLTRAVLLDIDGVGVCGNEQPLSVAGTESWEDFRERPRFVIGAPRTGRLSGQAIVAGYYPMPSERPEAFAIAVGIDLTFLRGLAASDLTPRPFAILGREGAILATGGIEGTAWLPEDRDQLLTYLEGTVVADSIDGIERRFFIDPLITGQLWAVIAAPEATSLDFLISTDGVLVLAPILLWLIAVSVAAIAIDRLVTRHVRYLSRVAARLGRGDLSTDIQVLDGAPSEIKRLGDAIRVMARNLAERDTALQDMVATQKTLLLEVHHRVKNNLQMISSLMNMQLRRSANPDEQRSLKLVQERIHGLALVHQSLYATERLDSIPLENLLSDLCEHLSASLKPARAVVRIESDLDHVIVGTEVATPIALFMTEAISNIFKHAVAPMRRTVISVTLRRSDESFTLMVANDVAGTRVPDLAGAATLERSTGLGARLMDGFAKQIGGTCSREVVDDRFTVVLTAPLGPRHGPFELRSRQAQPASADAGAEAEGEA